MMSLSSFWSESRWSLGFGAWGKDYTIVKAPSRGGYHVGLDSATNGDIPCLVSGTVVTVFKTGTMGYCVEIDTGAPRIGRGRYFTYCHIAGDNVPREGQVIAVGARVGRTARGPHGVPYTSIEFPGTAWDGIHCHLVISDHLHAAWTTVTGRTLAAFYDPAPIIRSVLASPAGDDFQPFPTPETKLYLEAEDMANPLAYYKGDKSPEIYAIYLTAGAANDAAKNQGGVYFARRYVTGVEWTIAQQNGYALKTLPQASFDSIPKVFGSK